MGVLLRPPESIRQSMVNTADYKIQVGRNIFIKYVEDMSILVLDVIDDRNMKPFGLVRIQMELYIKNDENLLEIFGSFPITTLTGMEKIGEVDLSVKSEFRGGLPLQYEILDPPQISQTVQDSLDSFKLNELRAQAEASQDKGAAPGTVKIRKSTLKRKIDFEIPEDPTQPP
jgi:hypothetical protein